MLTTWSLEHTINRIPLCCTECQGCISNCHKTHSLGPLCARTALVLLDRTLLWRVTPTMSFLPPYLEVWNSWSGKAPGQIGHTISS